MYKRQSGNILDITYNQGINGQGLNLSNGDLTISNNGQVFLNKQNVGSITPVSYTHLIFIKTN